MCQMNGETELEVEPEVFMYFLKNQSSPSISYGSPMVQLFEAGTMDKVKAWEKMRPEEQATLEHEAKKRGCKPWQI